MKLEGLFNARAEEIGHELRMREVPQKGGTTRRFEIDRLGVRVPEVGVLADEDAGSVTVICNMGAGAACDGLVTFSTAIDAVMRWRTDAQVKKRNDVLKRLHLFDGGMSTGKTQQTTCAGRCFSVKLNCPNKGLMLFQISELNG